MAKDLNDPQSVTGFIQKLDVGLAGLMEAIRQLILDSDKSIGEQIKWNAPSFFYLGEMKAFNPKEYKRDIIVLNIRKEAALLVFPTGAVINNVSGILEGNYADGRRLVTIKNMTELKNKGKHLQLAIKEWIEKVEK